MKRFLSALIACVMLLSLTACGGGDASTNTASRATGNGTFKMGAVLIGDENEGYTYAHIEGILNALKENGLSENDIIWKYSISESEAAHDACVDLAENGCNLIISNSYGHQSYTQQSAEEYPELQFVAMTGDTARKSGLPNFHNAFTKIYEARFVGGVVAGLKLNELVAEGKLTDKNYKDGKIKLGYVGAYPYAEVVSGYT
ncbi:MAG: BMP family ABC transporter substrate-binding protein, partial [Lachnospiraceae bacterium]|nr:BMP family ABC transporter substrate-binding protein [Lachnospiraceae bacterium]